MRIRGAALTLVLTVPPLAAVLLANPAPAGAQPVTGPYVGGGIGVHIPQNPRFTPLAPGFGGGRGTLSEGIGFEALGSVGYGLGNGARFEVEGDFSRTGIRSLSGTPFPTTTSGNVRRFGVMGNALYDMDIGMPWLYPYIGVGAGYQWTKLTDVSVAQVGGPFRYNMDSGSGSFAWQGIVGASMPLPYLPGLSATVDYRFMDTLGGEKFGGIESTSAGGPSTAARIKLGNQLDHSVILGVRYAFNTPSPPPPEAAPPAPAAVPAPAQARSYLVFFDWDKSTLTERARSIIKDAAENSTRVSYTRIEVNGYADTSGTPQYNQGLSIRRAQVVQGELVRDGVPQIAITIQGFGDTHLLVPTGPGVREPQNRRVEIIIR